MMFETDHLLCNLHISSPIELFLEDSLSVQQDSFGWNDSSLIGFSISVGYWDISSKVAG